MGEFGDTVLAEDLAAEAELVFIDLGARIECAPFLDVLLDAELRDRLAAGETRLGFC